MNIVLNWKLFVWRFFFRFSTSPRIVILFSLPERNEGWVFGLPDLFAASFFLLLPLSCEDRDVYMCISCCNILVLLTCIVPASSVTRCSAKLFLYLFLRKESMILQLNHLTLQHGQMFHHMLHQWFQWIMMMASHSKVRLYSLFPNFCVVLSSSNSQHHMLALFMDAFLASI